MISLATCSYSEFKPTMGTAVRASRGAPKHFAYPLATWPASWPLWSWMHLARPEFEEKYLARLDRYGIDQAAADMAALADEYAADRLVLLCFEVGLSARKFCHRTMLGQWLADGLGIDVPELGAHR